MSKHCKNCGAELKHEFCSRCGQQAHVERITYSYLWHEVFHFFTHIEKGFIFTSWKMIVSPGKTVDEFVAGKRKTYQSPVSYFLVWTTVYILLLYLIERFFGENVVINYRDYFGPAGTTHYAISHLSLVLTIVVPFQAFYLFLLFTRIRYNYFESLAAALYVMGTIILFQFLFALLALLFYAYAREAIELRISDIFKLLYLTWFVFDFILRFNVKLKFLKAIIFIILALGTFTVWRLYGVPELFGDGFLNH